MFQFVRDVVLVWLSSGQGVETFVTPPLPPAPPAITATCTQGVFKQGGIVLCEGPAGATVMLNGEPVAVLNEQGRAAIGLSQKAPDTITTRIEAPGILSEHSFDIASRTDPYREITGFDCDKVDARTQSQKDHAGESWLIKQAAFETFHDGNGAFEGFIRPAEGRASSPFGPTRKYIGVSKVTGEPCERFSIHRGYDIATPVGTPLIAPADGVVTLAETDLYYEGGAIFLDHGQGLKSVFIHLSEIDVSVGDVVKTGDRLGATGNTGRTTGPHLHWAVKWRNTASDNRDDDFYIDPALLLQLER